MHVELCVRGIEVDSKARAVLHSSGAKNLAGGAMKILCSGSINLSIEEQEQFAGMGRSGRGSRGFCLRGQSPPWLGAKEHFAFRVRWRSVDGKRPQNR